MPRPFDLEAALKTAAEVHGGFYLYDRIRYSGVRKKVEIVCPDHGPFWQRIDHHVNGHKCRKCAARALSAKVLPSFDEFKAAALKVHADRYGYPGQPYAGKHSKVSVVCPDHGPFLQRAGRHLSGMGCAVCAQKGVAAGRRLTTDGFIVRAKAVHGDKYDYRPSRCTGTHRPLAVGCRQHGVFWQRPANHLSGKGCPQCARYGFQQGAPAFLYVLYSGPANAFKIGVTNNFDQRLPQLTRAAPFAFDVLAVRPGPGDEVWAEERAILSATESAGLSGFDGATEWRKPNQVLFEKVRLYSDAEAF